MRVIRAGGPPLPRARVATQVRTIDGERWNARLEGEKLIAEAQAEAEAIVAAARARADEIAEEARKTGTFRAEAESAALVIRARAEATSVAERATEVVVHATRAVAERALGNALATDDALLSSWAREAIATLAGARRVAVYGHPATLARLDLPVMKHEAELPEGTLLVRSDLGEVKLELTTQLDALVAAVAELLAAEVRRRA